MLLFLRRQFAAEILLQPGWQFVRQLLEMVARALLHLESGLIEARHAVRLAHLDAAEEPAREQLVLVPGKLYHFAIQVRVVFFFQLVKVIQFGVVEPLEHRALLRRARLIARQLVKVERVQLELHGIADGPETHGIAQVAIRNHLQIAAAQEALPVGNGESTGELEAALASPGVAHLGTADFVFFNHRAAFWTSRWHSILPLPEPVPATRPAPVRPCIPASPARPACRRPWPG